MKTSTKEQVLADVGMLVRHGSLTLKELEDVYSRNIPAGAEHETSAAPANTSAKSGATLATALYVVGTLIVCSGIYMLISQNWDQLNTVFRIWFTLGLGLAVLAGALYRSRGKADVNKDLLASSLFTIAGVAVSIGVAVCVVEANGDINRPGTITGISLVLLGVFSALYIRLVRSLVLLYLAIAASLALYYAGIEWATHDLTKPDHFYALQTSVAGVLMVAGGIMLRTRAIASRISDTLYCIGAVMTLGGCLWATFTLNFYGGSTSTLLADVLYPFALAAGVWLSVFVRSRSVLVVTAFFLTCYIFKISATYFSQFLGGSLALLLAGVLVIGMAYGTTRFAKRYIHR